VGVGKRVYYLAQDLRGLADRQLSFSGQFGLSDSPAMYGMM
jgi:hypothetical protein